MASRKRELADRKHVLALADRSDDVAVSETRKSKARPFEAAQGSVVTKAVSQVTSQKQLVLFKDAIAARGVRDNTVEVLSQLAGMFEISPSNTKLDVWKMVEKRGLPLHCEADFARLKAIKRALSTSEMPSPKWAIEAYVQFVGPANVNVQTIKRLLRYRGGTDCLKIAHEIAKSPWELRRTNAVPRAQLRQPRTLTKDDRFAHHNRRFREVLVCLNTRKQDRELLHSIDKQFSVDADATLADVWNLLSAQGFPLNTLEDFKHMVRVRRALKVSSQPYPEWIRQTFIEYVGKDNDTPENLKVYLGIFPHWSEATRDEVLGLGRVGPRRNQARVRSKLPSFGAGAARTFHKIFGSHGLTDKSWEVLRQVETMVQVEERDTATDVWNKLVDQRFPLDDPQDFFWMLEVRKALMVSKKSYPEWILERLPAVIGAANINPESVRVHLGWQTASENLEAIRGLTDTVHQELSRQVNAPGEHLLMIFDEPVRERIRNLIDQAEAPLAENNVGRVLDIPAGPVQRMYALALIAQLVFQRRRGTVGAYFSNLKRTIEFFELTDPFDSNATDLGFQAFILDESRKETRATRMYFVRNHFALRNLVAAFIDMHLENVAVEMHTLVPAPFEKSKALRRLLGEIRAETEEACRARRSSKVAELIPRASHIVAALDHRFAQVEAPFFSFAEALKQARSDGQPTCERVLEVEIPVVLPDGTVRPGLQVVRFKFLHKTALLQSIIERDPEARWASERLREIESRGQVAGGPAADGYVLEYLETVSTVEGGETAEPFWVDWYRLGIFHRPRDLPRKVWDERERYLKGMGLPTYSTHPTEFLGFTWEDTPLVRAMVEQKRIILPMVSLYHAMLIAFAAARYTILWVPRSSELLQFRADGAGVESICGQDRAFMRLKRKGRKSDEKLGLDVVTLGLLKDLRLLTSWRWYGLERDEAGKPKISVFPYHSRVRDDLPPALYLLQRQQSALAAADVNLLVRYLYRDIVDVRMHDWRFHLATSMAKDGASKKQIGEALGHSRGFAERRYYDMSKALSALASAEAFSTAGQNKRLSSTHS